MSLWLSRGCNFGRLSGLIGRKPSDEEYRALRTHLDEGSPLPDDEVFNQLQNPN